MIAYLVMSWLLAFASNQKIALYCSDVSGAFDRVKSRLMEKLRSAGLHPKLVRVLDSWLKDRRANVVIGGSMSQPIFMRDMVYQGTVLGPLLWNIFFKDASDALRIAGFSEMSYANNLSGSLEYPTHLSETFYLIT